MWLVATVSDSAGLGNFSLLCQTWFRAAFQKLLRYRGAFAALPKDLQKILRINYLPFP